MTLAAPAPAAPATPTAATDDVDVNEMQLEIETVSYLLAEAQKHLQQSAAVY